MGCCCSKAGILPDVADLDEYKEFQNLLNEDIGGGNSHGWEIKKNWPRGNDNGYKNDFKMRVSLRRFMNTNDNKLLRGDGKYRGLQPQHFLDYLLNPENLPGLLECKDVQDLPDGCIKYLRVKAPGLKPRDHVWKYTIKKEGDGSIFVCIRSTAHDDYPEIPGTFRAYYYNSCKFAMSATEPGILEMTEFIFQDLKGGICPCLMNAALPVGTVAANNIEMDHFKKKGIFRL